MVLTTFLADLRSYTLPVGPPKGHEKPPVDSIASNSHIDLRIQLLALTASEPTTKKKSPLRSSVKTFLTACSRAFCPRIESAPHEENLNTHGALHMFGALGPYCCEAVLNNLPLSQLKLQEQVQITLNKVFDEIHVENEPSLQSEIISSLYNLVKSMISSPFVDNASFFALMERCLNSFTSDIKVPQILTDLITHDTSSRVLNGYISQNADLIYDLLSVGLTEMLEEDGRLVNGPAASTATQSNHLDAIDIAMRRHVKKAIEQSHASTPTARQAPAREQNWETIKELLWPIADRLSMSGPQLFEAVFQLLTSDRSDEHIQEELIDFLGLDQFETVSNLITDRAAWNVWHKRYRIDPQGVQNDGDSKRTKKSKSKKQRRGADATDHPHVNDATATDVVEMLLNNPETLAREREEQLMAAAASSSSRFTATKTSYADTEQPKLPFVFDALAEARGRGGFSGARKMALPEGTATGHKDDWDFFEFPIPKKDTLDFLNVPVIEISQLDRIGRIAFEGVERLNPIQSIVFDAAYNSSENLLICAPTGAGKTNTAMLTVVRLIREHLNEDFVLDLKSFKVVYMAPMKALAAEMTATFSKRLNPLGIKVRECTGDMQLSKQEIMDTQMLVTTPEKWDVISRKGAGDASLVQALKLLIIDEVHLLHEDRGAVIEALVARTLRQVEVSQSMIRIVGLSATLPNYVDVAQFLRVNLNRGLFYFDSRFRPVPLGMSFLGVTPPNRHSQEEAMNEACYQKVIEQLRRNEQVMVFVHARGETSKTARWIRDAATQRGDMVHFQPLAANTVDLFKRVPHCHDATVRELAVQGIACHHAGMLRPDRRLVEQLFSNRVIRVLVCTATLAWGVNLPAHAVIIKGTKIYDADKSDFVDLDILDVVQIFGRAGRPQFDTFGLATIITTRDKLDHYVRLITNQVAIESKLLSNINDHLNAEIALGTVTNIDEAVTWLSYTYLFVRLQRSPLNYGITPAALQDDPDFTHFMTSALRAAALELDRAEMVRYEESTGQLASTDRGRTASLYYIKYETAALVKDALHPLMLIADLFALISQAHEFSSMKVRDEEEGDLLDLEDNVCHVPVKNPGTVDSSVRKKINVLLQAYISRQQPRTHSLISDMNYIQQNAGRLARYIFEIAVRRGWAVVASNAHRLSKMIERQMWYDESPLWQLTISGKSRLLERVDIMGLTVDRIRELGPNELKDILRYEGKNGAQTVFEMAQSMPVLRMLVDTQPITRNIIRCHIKLEPDFTWVLSQHGQQLLYWIWIEDPEEAMIYHSEVFTLQRKAVRFYFCQNINR
uniref:Activating signal cointegrator 1 complex subunit 3 n=1 Tax=Schistocephalus solidus TaxID=70667 RepID=A0A0V0J941_SCHSO